jgi:hypothetical protein
MRVREFAMLGILTLSVCSSGFRVGMWGSLAVRLRLTPSSKLDRRTPQDGELPVS